LPIDISFEIYVKTRRRNVIFKTRNQSLMQNVRPTLLPAVVQIPIIRFVFFSASFPPNYDQPCFCIRGRW
jgi:hypothetical protein